MADVRRTMESFGPVLARGVPTGDGQLSLIVGHPTQRGDVETLESELPDATTAVTDVWGTDWAQSTVVAVASSPSEFAGLLHAPTMPTEVAAASVADPSAPGARPTGQRIVFSPDAGRRLDHDGLTTLLRHELTHIAARARTVDGAPLWMLEGFADYTAYHGRPRAFTAIAPTVTAHIRGHDLPSDLPADTRFIGPDAAFAYEQAWSICAFVAEKYARPRLVELYRQVASRKQDATSVDQSLRAVLGVDQADFVTEWRDWLSAQPI